MRSCVLDFFSQACLLLYRTKKDVCSVGRVRAVYIVNRRRGETLVAREGARGGEAAG